MVIDRKVCDRARRSRDARFDGKFFIAVTSTRIYCRPICPARSPKDENIRYYPTAAAAEAAGFRPCLRCRPEASPGTPAWSGTSSVVSRGAAADQRRRARSRRRRGAGRSPRRDGAPPAAAVRAASGRDADRRRADAARALRQEAARRNAACRLRRSRSPPALAACADSTARCAAPTRAPRPSCAGSRANDPTVRGLSASGWPIGRRTTGNTVIGFLAARATPGVELVEADRYQRTIAIDGTDGHDRGRAGGGRPGADARRAVRRSARAADDRRTRPAHVRSRRRPGGDRASSCPAMRLLRAPLRRARRHSHARRVGSDSSSLSARSSASRFRSRPRRRSPAGSPHAGARRSRASVALDAAVSHAAVSSRTRRSKRPASSSSRADHAAHRWRARSATARVVLRRRSIRSRRCAPFPASATGRRSTSRCARSTSRTHSCPAISCCAAWPATAARASSSAAAKRGGRGAPTP